jgi:hypothetical protein
MSLTSVDLPEPETPVTATKQPSGNDDVDVLQVVLAGADDGQLATGRSGRRTLAARDRRLPGQVLRR